MKELYPLRLNLQFFNDEDKEVVQEDEVNNADEISEKENKKQENDSDEKLFTQEEVNRILKDRLARDKKSREEAEEKKRLEDEGKFKELLEKANAKISELENEKALNNRKNLIIEKLNEKGLDGKEVQRLSKYVEKLVSTDDEVEVTVNEVYTDFIGAQQQSFGDPNAGFGKTKEREQKSDLDYGRELFARLQKK